MYRILFAISLGAIALMPALATAQNYNDNRMMYQGGPGGTPPLMYNAPGPSPWGNQQNVQQPPSPPVFQAPPLPSPPQIQSYVPAGPYQSRPCSTIPGSQNPC